MERAALPPLPVVPSRLEVAGGVALTDDHQNVTANRQVASGPNSLEAAPSDPLTGATASMRYFIALPPSRSAARERGAGGGEVGVLEMGVEGVSGLPQLDDADAARVGWVRSDRVDDAARFVLRARPLQVDGRLDEAVAHFRVDIDVSDDRDHPAPCVGRLAPSWQLRGPQLQPPSSKSTNRCRNCERNELVAASTAHGSRNRRLVQRQPMRTHS